MQLFLIQEGVAKDITKRTGEYIRTESLDELAMSFTFNLATNPYDKYLHDLSIRPGDKIAFINQDQTVFTGIITDNGWDGLYSHNYTAYDYAWYLNKNEVVIQFKGLAADQAIKQLCNQFDIPVGNITTMPTKIKKIYNGTVLSDCLKDIIEQTSQDTGKKYRMEMRDNKLYIEPYEDLVIQPMYKPASNIAPFDTTKVPADISGSESIADMSNAVKVVSSGEKSVNVFATVKDDASISKYGLMQKVQTADKKDKAKAGNIAKNLLNELNTVTKSYNVTLLGDDQVRAGRIINFDNPFMAGSYLVTGCAHNYTQAGHIMQLTLEAIE